MRLVVERGLLEAFPDLGARIPVLSGLVVRASSKRLEEYKKESYQRYRHKYALETLKDEAKVRAYRDFFWRVGIDPTKVRPASEALLRRVLRGGSIPRINTLVDAYNLASMDTHVSLAAFDLSTLNGDLLMRPAVDGEAFHGIGMPSPIALQGKEVVVEDSEGLIAVYPYRDADRTKVTTDTRDVVIMVCGVPGISGRDLEEAEKACTRLIHKFCGGAPSSF